MRSAGEQAPTIAWAANPNSGNSNSWNVKSVNFNVDVEAVPEPASYVLFMGFASLLLVIRRRQYQ